MKLVQLKSALCDLASDSRFASLGNASRRIWAIGAIHGEVDRLLKLHDLLFNHIQPGDRIVYLGNYSGYGASACETMDELLTFRRGVLAQPGMMPDDFVYLRGGQEEMWEKLQQLQFAPNPKQVLLWMLDNGMASTLEDYGLRPQDGLNAAGEGVMVLTRWTSAVRNAIRRYPGHDIFQCQLRRAAYTAAPAEKAMVFVHSGLNPACSLQEQGDALWWGGQNFNALKNPCSPFQKVVRGYDPKHGGLHIDGNFATLDGCCGFGGTLVAAGFDNGDYVGMLES